MAKRNGKGDGMGWQKKCKEESSYRSRKCIKQNVYLGPQQHDLWPISESQRTQTSACVVALKSFPLEEGGKKRPLHHKPRKQQIHLIFLHIQQQQKTNKKRMGSSYCVVTKIWVWQNIQISSKQLNPVMVNYPKKSTKTAFEGVGTGNFVRGLSACKNKQENFKKVVLNLQWQRGSLTQAQWSSSGASTNAWLCSDKLIIVSKTVSTNWQQSM